MALQKDFLWGGATAANQCEGAYLEGGRGLANVDVIPHGELRPQVMRGLYTMDRIDENQYYPALKGIDFYHHYKEDIKLLAEMGLSMMRFGICWTRIYPTGEEKTPNEEGLQFYEDVIDECLTYNIEPMITICHDELPLYLANKYDGWSNRIMIDFV